MNTISVDFQERLKQVGAWHTGHFLLASGLHSDQYIQCQRLLQYPRYADAFADELARQVVERGFAPRAVVGPALGAVHWELLVAQALDRLLKPEVPVRAIFAERPEGQFEIRRGIELEPGEQVLVVEDVTTTGGSARKVVELVGRLNACVVAVGAIIDRSGGLADFDVPFLSLLALDLKSYEADACPMCKAGQPLVKPGSTKITGSVASP